MLQRLKNLWAWSAYHPSGPPQDVGFSWTGWVNPVNQVEPPAEIIYPDKRKELLQAKSDPTLDELLHL